VSEDALSARPLALAAEIAPDPEFRCSAELIAPGQSAAVDWDSVALLLWQAPLPGGEAAKQVQAFIDRGGIAVFFPPRVPGSGEFCGARWTNWARANSETSVETWRGEDDLLAHTQSGQSLPVGQLEIRRHCGLSGDFTALTKLRGGAPLLARATIKGGPVYFCATTAAGGDSSLATSGVVLYVLVQRALAAGAAVLGHTRQLTAGDVSGEDAGVWKRIAGTEAAISTDFPFHQGVYSAGERLIAVNRAAPEDLAPVLSGRRVAELFRGLDFDRVDDKAGSVGPLFEEIWRLFLVGMLVAMLAEAVLCLPKVARGRGAVESYATRSVPTTNVARGRDLR
jgi:hypothetical protein